MAEFFTAGNCIWVTLALGWSSVNGAAATAASGTRDDHPTNWFNHWVWWPWYQFWFNFLAGIVGWIMLYFLWHADFKNPSVGHFVALAIAFLGITGNLPQIALRLRGPSA